MSQTSQPVENEVVRLYDLSLDAFCIAGLDAHSTGRGFRVTDG